MEIPYTLTSDDSTHLFWEGYLFWKPLAVISIFLLATDIFALVCVEWIINAISNNIYTVSFSFDWYFLFLFIFSVAVYGWSSYRKLKKGSSKAVEKESIIIIDHEQIIFTDKKKDNKRTLKRDDIKAVFERKHFLFFSLVNLSPKIGIPKRILTEKQKSILLNFAKERKGKEPVNFIPFLQSCCSAYAVALGFLYLYFFIFNIGLSKITTFSSPQSFIIIEVVSLILTSVIMIPCLTTIFFVVFSKVFKYPFRPNRIYYLFTPIILFLIDWLITERYSGILWKSITGSHIQEVGLTWYPINPETIFFWCMNLLLYIPVMYVLTRRRAK